MFYQNQLLFHCILFLVPVATSNKRTAFPHTPCGSFVLIFITIYILLVKIKTISILHLTGEAREIFDLSRSRSKKGEERTIKVLTSSPKTSKLNLQLI